MMTKDKLRQLKGDERLGQMRSQSTWVLRTSMTAWSRCLPLLYLWNGTVTLQRGKENKDVLPSPKNGYTASCRSAPDCQLHQPEDIAEAIR